MKQPQIYAFFLFFLFVLGNVNLVFAQDEYAASILKFRQQRENDFRNPQQTPIPPKKLGEFRGLLWYEVNDEFKIEARFVSISNSPRFEMPTFGNVRTIPHTKYGEVYFTWRGRDYKLNVYQNEIYQKSKFLFIPFLDLTNQKETYRGGRYLDFDYPKSEKVMIDFNLAYNPDCAYNEKYACPIPPEENRIESFIRAGEKLNDVKIKKTEDDATNAKTVVKIEKPIEPKKTPVVKPTPTPEILKATVIAKPKKTNVESTSKKPQVTPKAAPIPTPTPTNIEAVKREKKVAEPSVNENSGQPVVKFDKPVKSPTVPKKQMPTVVVEKTADGSFADYNGTKVHYESIGKGSEALIFIHGWGGNAEFWKGSVNAFPNLRTIAIDLPGHGASDKPRMDYSISYLARSIEAVMRTANVKKAVLIGHSMGTPVVREFYHLFPEKTLGLVFVDGLIRPLGTKEGAMQITDHLRTDYATNLESVIQPYLQPIQDDAVRNEVRASILATPDYVNISEIEAMADENIYRNLAISVPVLAIVAETPNLKPESVKQVYQSFALKLDFRSWQGVSHYLMLEKPREFNQTVRYFLNANKLLIK